MTKKNTRYETICLEEIEAKTEDIEKRIAELIPHHIIDEPVNISEIAKEINELRREIEKPDFEAMALPVQRKEETFNKIEALYRLVWNINQGYGSKPKQDAENENQKNLLEEEIHRLKDLLEERKAGGDAGGNEIEALEIQLQRAQETHDKGVEALEIQLQKAQEAHDKEIEALEIQLRRAQEAYDTGRILPFWLEGNKRKELSDQGWEYPDIFDGITAPDKLIPKITAAYNEVPMLSDEEKMYITWYYLKEMREIRKDENGNPEVDKGGRVKLKKWKGLVQFASGDVLDKYECNQNKGVHTKENNAFNKGVKKGRELIEYHEIDFPDLKYEAERVFEDIKNW